MVPLTRRSTTDDLSRRGRGGFTPAVGENMAMRIPSPLAGEGRRETAG
jgi:hypothetical protein